MTRWEVTKAVRKSDLAAPSRLLMLTLADSAVTGTAEIPPNHTPSVKVLSEETGLDRRTVQRHLLALEEAGWIVRSRPDGKGQWRGERVRYRLDLPSGVVPPDEQAADNRPAAQDRPIGGTESPEQAAQSPITGGTEPPQSQILSDQSQTVVRSPSSSKPKKALAVIDRPDVEHICRHLADRIQANGSKRPTVTQAWRDAARRLIDKDGRTVEQVVRAIDWCQADEFWRGNVLSMPKLREQYDRLRLAAARTNGHKPSTTDQRMAAAQALKAKLREAS